MPCHSSVLQRCLLWRPTKAAAVLRPCAPACSTAAHCSACCVQCNVWGQRGWLLLAVDVQVQPSQTSTDNSELDHHVCAGSCVQPAYEILAVTACRHVDGYAPVSAHARLRTCVMDAASLMNNSTSNHVESAAAPAVAWPCASHSLDAGVRQTPSERRVHMHMHV